MQIKLIALALVATVAAIPQVVNTRCNADNCARALTGTPATRSATRVAECSTFQTTTMVVTVVSGTPTVITRSTTTVPASLSSCVNSAAYASACSCAGVTKGTTSILVATPAATPLTFRIFDKDNSVSPAVIVPTFLTADQQDYGNVNAYVLGRQNYFGGTSPIFALTSSGQLQTQEQTPKYSLAYPGSASKIYFGQEYGDLNYQGLQYIAYNCMLGAFDGSVPGYPLTCSSGISGPAAFYQAGVNPNNGATGNIGFGNADQAQNEAPPPSGGAPDIFNQQLYAVGA